MSATSLYIGIVKISSQLLMVMIEVKIIKTSASNTWNGAFQQYCPIVSKVLVSGCLWSRAL